MKYKLCALIPTYNHHTQLPRIIKRLQQEGLPVFIVDDGSGQPAQKTLSALSGLDNVSVLRLPINGGKGAAIEAGLKWVNDLGYTHAFQLDADGQHSLDDLADFLELSERNPHAMLSGKPVYDDSMPLARKIGRWFTHVWVWIETLSFRISDSMCGFRIYPVAQSLAVIRSSSIGKRMDFDTEIMVHLFWDGVPVIMHPVKVIYPEDNFSNFDVLRDNWRITKMHTRLFFGMITKLPMILFRRPDYSQIEKQQVQEQVRWSSLSERGTVLGLFILATCYRFLGQTVCSVIGAPVVLYFYLTGSKQRKASSDFLSKVLKRKPTFVDGFRHFMSFFQMTLDKFAAWCGHFNHDSIESDDPERIHDLMTGPKGGIMVVCHLGNMEFCRAIVNDDCKKKMHILMHTKNSEQFNRMMTYFNPKSSLNIMEVSQMGPETMIFLKDRIDNGDWVVIAADRTPISENPRVTYVPFLGKEAAFSQGPYILASLLKCPVYTAVAIRIRRKHKVFMELFAEEVILQRGNKEACIREYAGKYALHLEKFAKEYPYQWYNFFDFWQS